MLEKYGLYAAIVDSYDKDMMALCRGERPQYAALVSGLMDGASPDMAALDEAGRRHVKTYSVLAGNALYSDSWLDV